MDAALFTEWQDVFDSRPRHSRLEQTRGALGKNHFLVRRDVVAVGMRNESEPLRLPGIEPQIVRGKENPVIVAHIEHWQIYALGTTRSTLRFFRRAGSITEDEVCDYAFAFNSADDWFRAHATATALARSRHSIADGAERRFRISKNETLFADRNGARTGKIEHRPNGAKCDQGRKTFGHCTVEQNHDRSGRVDSFRKTVPSFWRGNEARPARAVRKLLRFFLESAAGSEFDDATRVPAGEIACPRSSSGDFLSKRARQLQIGIQSRGRRLF